MEVSQMKKDQSYFPNEGKINDEILRLAELVRTTEGAERVWAHRNHLLLKEGYYSSEELINRATSTGFKLYDPFTRIHRGTTLEKNVIIGDGTVIEGENVIISEGTRLNRAIILGSNVKIGPNNVVSGEIQIDNLTTGNNNTIDSISGFNRGSLQLGSDNHIAGLQVGNAHDNRILIGNNNELWPGLSINIPFEHGQISIGHFNSLGRDGGGVISSSYRFGRRWYGPVCIGNHVQTTRGAEVLGFSLLGWPRDVLEKDLSRNEEELMNLFMQGNLAEISALFEDVSAYPLDALQNFTDEKHSVSLFGTVKAKRCLITSAVTVKDDTRILCAYVRDVLIPERCNIFYSSIVPRDEQLYIDTQDRALKEIIIDEDQDWKSLPKNAKMAYPESDADFYQDWSWPIP
jgi:serine acetyltransferase